MVTKLNYKVAVHLADIQWFSSGKIEQHSVLMSRLIRFSRWSSLLTDPWRKASRAFPSTSTGEVSLSRYAPRSRTPKSSDGATWSLSLARNVGFLAGDFSPFTFMTSPVINPNNNNSLQHTFTILLLLFFNLWVFLSGSPYSLFLSTRHALTTVKTNRARTIINRKFRFYTPTWWNRPEKIKNVLENDVANSKVECHISPKMMQF